MLIVSYKRLNGSRKTLNGPTWTKMNEDTNVSLVFKNKELNG